MSCALSSIIPFEVCLKRLSKEVDLIQKFFIVNED